MVVGNLKKGIFLGGGETNPGFLGTPNYLHLRYKIMPLHFSIKHALSLAVAFLLAELTVADRRQKREIRQLEQELHKWQVLVDSITGEKSLQRAPCSRKEQPEDLERT